MDVEWDDMKTTLAVVRSGTLAKAAAALGVNYTTIARRITRAETALDLTLFERLPAGYVPTDSGLLVAEHAARMEESQTALLRELQGQDQTLRGSLVITAPQLLIGPYLAPVIEAYCQAHPAVDVQVRATNDQLNLHRREADLAIRISRSPGDTLTGLRLCAQHQASFANAAWARRIEVNPERCIDWVVFDGSPEVPKASLTRYPNARVRLILDDMAAMVGAAQAGLGVVRTPMFLGRATPGLVQVPVLPPQSYADIWIVGHPDVWQSAKVTAFREILVPYFRSHRSDFVI